MCKLILENRTKFSGRFGFGRCRAIRLAAGAGSPSPGTPSRTPRLSLGQYLISPDRVLETCPHGCENTRPATAFPHPSPLRRRPLGVGMTSVGVPACIGALHPLFGEILAGAELAVILAVILTVIGTSLYGSDVLSERGFRLLRWFKDRPEPPARR